MTTLGRKVSDDKSQTKKQFARRHGRAYVPIDERKRTELGTPKGRLALLARQAEGRGHGHESHETARGIAWYRR
jgi:hypothetical protein